MKNSYQPIACVVNDETECLYSATKNVFKKIEEASEALRKQQNHILILQTDSVSLAQAKPASDLNSSVNLFV